MIKSSVLFVCLGNICRSPTAEAVFRAQVKAAGLTDQIVIDSAGTGDWHVGAAPDPRAQAAGLVRGFDLSFLRARQVIREDFSRYQWIIAMDQNNLHDLKQLSSSENHARLSMLLDYAKQPLLNKDVPDPYYGSMNDFHHVLDLVEDACQGLLAHIQQQVFNQESSHARSS